MVLCKISIQVYKALLVTQLIKGKEVSVISRGRKVPNSKMATMITSKTNSNSSSKTSIPPIDPFIRTFLLPTMRVRMTKHSLSRLI